MDPTPPPGAIPARANVGHASTQGPTDGVHGLYEGDAAFTGVTPGDRGGSALSMAGDVDGDGWGDILVGAPARADAGADSGIAWLLYSPFSEARSLSTADAAFPGEAAGDQVGVSGGVTGLADVDRGGHDDLFVAA